MVRRSIFSGDSSELSPAQRHMYASEKLMNFRWISKIMATYSQYTLTSSDLASVELQQELAEIGEFAEVAYAGLAKSLSMEFVFQNHSMLLKADFPLEGYEALKNSVLVSSVRGTAAGLLSYVAYRPHIRQLVLAISGTATITQALYDVRALKHRYPVGRGCRVHTGFWKLYNGLKPHAFEAIKAGLKKHDVESLVITGHSMGGALSYLLALDVMADNKILPHGLPLKIVVFGAPRCGNSKLAQYWFDGVNEYREKNGGEGSFAEYSVKAYNDGVPSLPPSIFGYRHFTRTPLFFVRGRLYHVPSAECESALFMVSSADDKDEPWEHPRGGHNYYNGRNMERFTRRMRWLDGSMCPSTVDWEERYLKRVVKREQGWLKK